MGVPVLTLTGATHASRVTASLLASVGLNAWAAPSVQAFVERACKAAGDLNGLSGLRAGLRARMRASPLCDGPSYAAAVEAAYREMWARTSG
jgi:predicted O-linked N-acetylglucosamine transferase (SPINDLY family)